MMSPEDTMKFKVLFENQRNNLLYHGRLIHEDFHLQRDDLMDEVDATSSELETAMRLRLRNREALFLKKIEEALRRITEGRFGDCESCGDPIELRRLEARPTTDLCVSCKEEQERTEHAHIDGHRSKSLGIRLRFA